MPELEKQALGRTGLRVTELGYGAMELRGPPRGREVTKDQARAILNQVLESGINYIDTSIDYGQSEELIGELIATRRNEFYLASKCGCLVGEAANNPPPPGSPNRHIFTPENVVAGIEQSLRRMKTEYLDVVQFHGSPSRDTLEENGSIQAVKDLQRQGKVRFIGMSSTLPNIRDHIAMGVFDVFQIPYSALERQHEQVIADASTAGAGIVIRGGVARGGPGKEQGAAWDTWQKAGLDELLDGTSRMEFLFRFTISHPDLDTTIVGTINPQHLQDNLSAMAKGPLPPDVYQQAKRRLDAAGVKPA
jgi:aryl-alcohol dehydrogenase-like predicted oxidoreductase